MLNTGKPPHVDLHLSLHGESVLYCQAGSVFTEEAKQRLITNGIDTLYVNTGSLSSDQAASQLAGLLALPDSELKSEVKASFIQAASSSTATALIDQPGRSEAQQAVYRLSSVTVDHVMGGTRNLATLIKSIRHDDRLSTHAANTAIYATALGHEIGLGRSDLVRLSVGAFLHDLGMTQVPSEIREKPTRTTDLEWLVIENHPFEGVSLLSRDLDDRDFIALIVRDHHERADGTGYPNRIAETRIHYTARIVSIADAYDALRGGSRALPAVSSFKALQLMTTALRGAFSKNYLAAFVRMFGDANAFEEAEKTMPDFLLRDSDPVH